MPNIITQVQVGGTTYDIRDTSKAPINSPAFTGTPTAPTVSSSDISDKIATTRYVHDTFGALNDAMVFKGTIGNGVTPGTVDELPDNPSPGWTYKVVGRGTFAGQWCEVGDLIIAIDNQGVDADWTVVQGNVSTAVSGPDSSSYDHVATFWSTDGKLIKDSGFTIGTSVPANAVFTDHMYGTNNMTIGSASAGTALKASKVTSFDVGTVPTLGESIVATKITAWSAGNTPTLGTAIPADDITSWDPGTLPTIIVDNGVLKFTVGTLPYLSYTAKSIPNVTSVGSTPSITKTDVTIPNITDVGTTPSLTYTEVTIPNISVTSKTVVGSLKSL